MGRESLQRSTAGEALEEPWTLPEGWRWERLGRYVSKSGTSINPARSPNDNFQTYSVPSFPSGRPETLKGSAIGSSKQSVSAGDVLLCKINPRINRVWKVRDYGTGHLIASTEWIRFSVTGEVDPDYLRYFLMRNAVRDYLAMNVSGVGGSLMRVKPSTVEPIKFPLAPKPAQRQIVASIDRLFADIDDGETALTRAWDDLATLRKALLKAAVTGELTADWRAANPPTETGADLLARILAERRVRWHAEPRNKGKRYVEPAGPDTDSLRALPNEWTWASLGQISTIGSGTTPSRANPAYWAGSTPWLKSACVNDDVVTSAEEFVSNLAVHEARLKTFPIGTLVVALYGEGKTRGKCAVLDIEATVNQALGAVQVGPGIEVDWVKTVLDADYEKNRLISAGGVQPNLNLVKLAALPVALPPTSERAIIASRLSASLDSQDETRYASEIATETARSLRQSTLAAAFRGELAA